MKRVLIFALLGPPLGFVTGFYVMLPLMSAAVGDSPQVSFYQLVLLPLAYFMGLVPAVLAGIFDESVAHRRFRILWTALFAFGAVSSRLPERSYLASSAYGSCPLGWSARSRAPFVRGCQVHVWPDSRTMPHPQDRDPDHVIQFLLSLLARQPERSGLTQIIPLQAVGGKQ